MMSSKDKVITSPTVGSGVCLVVLCPETARCESECPLYCVELFCALSPHEFDQPHYKLLLISLQNFTDHITNFTDLITKLY